MIEKEEEEEEEAKEELETEHFCFLGLEDILANNKKCEVYYMFVWVLWYFNFYIHIKLKTLKKNVLSVL